jgi:hypothetical protein
MIYVNERFSLKERRIFCSVNIVKEVKASSYISEFVVLEIESLYCL